MQRHQLREGEYLTKNLNIDYIIAQEYREHLVNGCGSGVGTDRQTDKSTNSSINEEGSKNENDRNRMKSSRVYFYRGLLKIGIGILFKHGRGQEGRKAFRFTCTISSRKPSGGWRKKVQLQTELERQRKDDNCSIG